MKKTELPRVETGVPNLDLLLGGGLPKNSVSVLAGSPGAGKTILAQQICFHNASRERPALFFSTMSEPTAKTLSYLQQFSFFDPKKLDSAVYFTDIGVHLRGSGLEETSKLLMDHVRRVKPALVVIDSFKVFDEMARSREDQRKFGYELAIHLMAWETTALLLGEYGRTDLQQNPLFSIVDGLLLASQREHAGEPQRFLQILKMRGTAHSLEEHSFLITPDGVEIFAPRVTIHREARRGVSRCKTLISRLDDLLGEGIPRGSSLLVSGVAGTGKTVLLLEFIYRGARAGEKGVLFSFEETEERLRAAARGLGWALDREIERGMVEIVFIPQPDIIVDEHLLMMRKRIEASGAKRVAVDSLSVFLHKTKEPEISRERTFQLGSIIQNCGAVGFFATDVPYGSNQISRFGVEETVVDGVILLTSTEEGFERQRYIEIYKLRNTAHLKGRHNMSIGPGGLTVFPRYGAEAPDTPPPAVEPSRRRLSSGVPNLDELLGGGFLRRSVTLLSGAAGIGKSTLGLQFIAEGVKRKERGLYVALEEGPAQILATAEALGIPLTAAIKQGLLEIVYLSREHVRANQFLAILAEKIRAQATRRLVLDSVNRIITEGLQPEEARHLLQGLVTSFKSLGVTSVLTLEVSSTEATDLASGRGLSPLADNVILMRYADLPSGLRSTLTVLKTRASAHDWGTYNFVIAKGGIRLTGRVAEDKVEAMHRDERASRIKRSGSRRKPPPRRSRPG
jgi:circadian clock protein KaiC